MTHARFTVTDMHRFRADWMVTARKVAAAMSTFTSDDIWEAMPGWSKGDWAPSSGDIGNLMSQLHKERIARPTDRVVKSSRPASKGRRISIWESTVSESVALQARGQMSLV